MDFTEYLARVLESDEKLRKEYEALESEYKLKDAMIGASNKAGLKKDMLIDIFYKGADSDSGGLIGVYNLGMKHMWEYLNDKKIN